MKLNIKLILGCTILGVSSMGFTSCDDFLDREPITSVTPAAYFKTADQLASYVDQYYASTLVNSRGQSLFHDRAWNQGLAINDDETDNYVKEEPSNNYFGEHNKQVPEDQNLVSTYSRIRRWNYFINTVEPLVDNKEVQGSTADINHYLGEGYFFRAMEYYNAMVKFGDLPIVKEVLPDERETLEANSVRAPRNEVARFILSDLDKAISLLKAEGYSNQRVTVPVARLFKARVALFEASFETYHKGSGRVPGDSNWPGQSFSGNIDTEIDFFLTQAMSESKAVADATVLTENSHAINPSAVDELYGWNPYFEMFSQPTLAGVSEVLLWRQYNSSYSITHNAPNRTRLGDNSGLTRSMVNSFLMKDGLPYYASPLYKGDKSIDDESIDRDERMQLFVWAESDVLNNDTKQASVAAGGMELHGPTGLCNPATQNWDRTGYRQRKHYTYDHSQKSGDELLGTNACPVFRSAEALLIYIEASYMKEKSINATAAEYWRKLRARAGVSTDFQATIAATDMSKEVNDLGSYSGSSQVDATLYNIRRERRCEFMGEGFRWDDLLRWRSWDRTLTTPFIPEGINVWDEAYKAFNGGDYGQIKAENTNDSNVSPSSLGKYVRPYALFSSNNPFFNGLQWMEAYYLEPISLLDLQLAPQMYQNINWPSDQAGKAEK